MAAIQGKAPQNTQDVTPQAQADVNKDLLSELESLKAENARLAEEADKAKSDARNAEAEAKAARDEAEAAGQQLKERIAAADAEAIRQEAAITRQLNAERRVRIIISSGRDPHERAPVPIAVNGREFLIVRDKEVDVPEAVINVLDLAKEKVAEVTEINGQRHVSFRDTHRFAFQVLGYVDPKTKGLER